MFVGFDLSLMEDSFLTYDSSRKKIYESYGEEILAENKKNVQASLDNYFNKNGTIDGSKVQSDWFPQIECDIFLSHSHKDEKQAIRLAGWLQKEFGLKVFIDSCVWRYSLDLQQILDDEYCQSIPKQNPKMYVYDKVMYSTSHVHMMLSTALTMMIDKCESVFFFNTPNSISSKDTINQTESPWIYHELAMTKLVRKYPLTHYRMEIIKEARYELNQQKALKITYDVGTDHLVPLNSTDLTHWKTQYDRLKSKPSFETETFLPFDKPPLDLLYVIKNILKSKVGV